jgi:hypothetical protein
MRKDMKFKALSLSIAFSIAISGCATSSKNISADYVSSVQYQAYNCHQITMEMQNIQSKVTQLGGKLDTAADHDKMITGAGVLIFWPALFFLGGNKQQEAEYANLKGQYQALQNAFVSKNCSHQNLNQ